MTHPAVALLFFVDSEFGGGESVGWIEAGTITDSLRVGLLESWGSRFT